MITSPVARLAPAGAPRVARPIRLLRAAPDVLVRAAGPPQPGRVHSVFTRAVNLEWADGHLVTLQVPGPLHAPFAGAVPRLPRDLWPGAPASIGGGVVRVGTETIQAAGARRAETTLGTARATPAVLREALRSLPPSAPSLDSPAARAAQARLAEGMSARDLERLVAGAARLVGLGEGLTPAGDDCLVGALAAVHALAPGWAASWPRAAAPALTALVALTRARTTAIAAAFLTHALRGEMSEPLLALLSAPTPGAARAAAARLARLGATSGADTLRGLSLAVAALAR